MEYTIQRKFTVSVCKQMQTCIVRAAHHDRPGAVRGQGLQACERAEHERGQAHAHLVPGARVSVSELYLYECEVVIHSLGAKSDSLLSTHFSPCLQTSSAVVSCGGGGCSYGVGGGA